ncbi:hypothetical protein CDAR_418961 [Caerostris darwini]|uniref:Uncharacterized protein n=1 Tax=Caerostris darwini TaxID=1538125 RepID=A0AAV4MVN4_9ARAC|nr:hypothetical protein CDAR_418961 [Caerostris darwini]
MNGSHAMCLDWGKVEKSNCMTFNDSCDLWANRSMYRLVVIVSSLLFRFSSKEACPTMLTTNLKVLVSIPDMYIDASFVRLDVRSPQ